MEIACSSSTSILLSSSVNLSLSSLSALSHLRPPRFDPSSTRLSRKMKSLKEKAMSVQQHLLMILVARGSFSIKNQRRADWRLWLQRAAPASPAPPPPAASSFSFSSNKKSNAISQWTEGGLSFEVLKSF